MPTSLPANYDWSGYSYPSGPFGVEDVPGATSVFEGLSGTGGLGTEGILNFAKNYSPGAGGLDNILRLAGSLGSLFSEAGSTAALDKMADKTTKDIDKRIANIYPGLTGLTGEQALNKYYNSFADTVAKTTAQGRADLGISPDLSTEYSRLGSRIQDITNQYSLANKLADYSTIASQGAEPGRVTTIDAASIRDVADWVDPMTNQIKAKYKAFYDYGDPQTQRFIYGARDTSDAVGKYYNTSGDVSGLMNYGGLG